jgi:2-oxoisovalerate dehydrogenase E1 component alpha subunit
MIEAGIYTQRDIEQIHSAAKEEIDQAAEQVSREPRPQPSDVNKHTYAPSPVDAVYPGDYTGLP